MSVLRKVTAWSRVCLGVALYVAPQRAARTWFGGEPPENVKLLFRSVGARDVALGAGLLTERSGEKTWLRAGVASDIGDTFASVLAVGPIPAAKLVPGTVLALAFVATGLWVDRAEPDTMS